MPGVHGGALWIPAIWRKRHRNCHVSWWALSSIEKLWLDEQGRKPSEKTPVISFRHSNTHTCVHPHYTHIHLRKKSYVSENNLAMRHTQKWVSSSQKVWCEQCCSNHKARKSRAGRRPCPLTSSNIWTVRISNSSPMLNQTLRVNLAPEESNMH